MVLVQALGVQLASEEHLVSGFGLLDAVVVDAGGLVQALVLRQGVAVPVGVLDQLDLLVGLVLGQHPGAVGEGGLQRGAVSVGEHAVGLNDQGLVQGDVDQVGTGQVVVQVEAFQGLVQHQGDLVVTGGQETNVVPFHGGVDVVISQVIRDIGLGLAPVGVGRDHGHQPAHGLVGQGDVAIFVGSASQSFPVLHAEVGIAVGVDVLLQGVAGQPIGQASLHGDVNDLALVGQVDAILTLGEVSNDETLAIGVVLLVGDLTAGVGIALGILDDQLAGVVGVSTVVGGLGVEQVLGRLHEVSRGDGGAILPLQVVAQGDLPGAAGLALGNAPLLADVISGHVNGELGSHAGNHHVAVVGLVEIETIEAVGQVVRQLAVGIGLHLEGAPNGGELGHIRIVRISRFCFFSHSNAAQHAQRHDQSQNLLHGGFLLERFFASHLMRLYYYNCSTFFLSSGKSCGFAS